jgi:hypothetical protein
MVLRRSSKSTIDRYEIIELRLNKITIDRRVKKTQTILLDEESSDNALEDIGDGDRVALCLLRVKTERGVTSLEEKEGSIDDETSTGGIFSF